MTNTNLPDNLKDLDLKGAPVEETRELLGRNLNIIGLQNEISKRAGMFIELKNARVKPNRRFGYSVTWDSSNHIDASGIFAKVFKEVTIEPFDGSIGTDKSNSSKIRAWIPIHINWKHNDGGTNSADWFTAWYDFTLKEWTFSD